MKRRRLTPERARQLVTDFEQVTIRELRVDLRRAVDLGLELGIYAYDAYTLEGARSSGSVTVTSSAVGSWIKLLPSLVHGRQKLLKTVEARDDTFDRGENRWDLILLSYAGCGGENVARIERALKPGACWWSKPSIPMRHESSRLAGSLCGPGRYPHMFQGLRTVHYEEPIALPDFGQARMRIVRFAAEKPR